MTNVTGCARPAKPLFANLGEAQNPVSSVAAAPQAESPGPGEDDGTEPNLATQLPDACTGRPRARSWPPSASLPAGALADRGGHRKRIYKLAPEGRTTTARRIAACDPQLSRRARPAKRTRRTSSSQARRRPKDEHKGAPRCRCGVKSGRKLPHDVWHDLFHPKSGNKHVVVDKRDPPRESGS